MRTVIILVAHLDTIREQSNPSLADAMHYFGSKNCTVTDQKSDMPMVILNKNIKLTVQDQEALEKMYPNYTVMYIKANESITQPQLTLNLITNFAQDNEEE